MPATIEVKYFNSFVLKKVLSPSSAPVWNGSFGIPQTLGGYNQDNAEAADANIIAKNWAIEESRIRGGYNNTSVSFGPRAYLVEEEPNATFRINSLIYSGIFNSSTGINDTNVFSVGTDITKSLNPAYGSIQKLYAQDYYLTIFQENKVSTALIDKDAIYSAEGTPINTVSNVVIGQVTPYTGEYGISRNPESFASFGFRRYFADKDRSAILRLSRDGITEISQYGMKDFFRDELAKLKDKQQVFSEEYKLQYNTTAGSITQGPQVPGGIPTAPGFAAQRVPDPLGPWFVAGTGKINIAGTVLCSVLM